MPVLNPIRDDTPETFVNRFVALFGVDVTRRMDAQQAVLGADIQRGDGTMIFVDVVGDVFEAAR